jgi:RimJ/RimL family protein N-acetyltransferase
MCVITGDGDDDGTFHLSIGIVPLAQNKGYAKAAVKEATKLVRQIPSVKALAAYVEDDNGPSKNLMSKFDGNPTWKIVDMHFPDRTVKQWKYKLF